MREVEIQPIPLDRLARLLPPERVRRIEDNADGRLRITIANDGPARPSASRGGAGIGLGNARARLAQLYGDAHELRLVDRAEGGVELSLGIPFQPAACDPERAP